MHRVFGLSRDFLDLPAYAAV